MDEPPAQFKDGGPAKFAGVVSPSAAARSNNQISQTLKPFEVGDVGLFFDDPARMNDEVEFFDDFKEWMPDIMNDKENVWRDKVSIEFRRLMGKEEGRKLRYTEGSFTFKKGSEKDQAPSSAPAPSPEPAPPPEPDSKKRKTEDDQDTSGSTGAGGGAMEGTKTKKASAPKMQYAEKSMKNLLEGLVKVELRESYMGIYSKFTGLPDNAVLINNKTYVLGELKHGDSYNTEHALYQLSQYLLLELFWLRVILRGREEEVYGFFMMGPKCKDIAAGRYHVGFVRVQVPKVLGGVVDISYWLSKHELNDLSGYKYVYNFLKSGKCSYWTAKKPHEEDQQDQQLQPSLLYIPNGVLSLCEEPTNDIELISNGTNAIVFKAGSVASVGTLFEQTAKTEALSSFSLSKREEYTTCIDSLQPHGGPFYVKVRTTNMSCNWGPGNAAAYLNSTRLAVDDALTRLYPIETFADSTMLFMVMNDLGERPSKASLGDLETTIELFSQLSKRMLLLASKCFYHGDALLHNCLVRLAGEERFLELVDFDEGGDEIPERDIDSLPKGIDFRRCRYPDNIGRYYRPEEEKNFWYTVVQLSVLFTQLCCFFEDAKTNARVQAVRRALAQVEPLLIPEEPLKSKIFQQALDDLRKALPGAE